MDPLAYLAEAPQISPIMDIITPEVIEDRTKQGIPVYEIRKAHCGVIYIELCFRAGRPQEHKRMVAACTAALIREGAGRRSSSQIAEEIDFLGATLSTKAGLDFISLKGVCLQRHFVALTEIMADVLGAPHYDEQELRLLIGRAKERLKIQTSKPDIKSYRLITEMIYGAEHPYGYNSTAELYDEVEPSDLHQHHRDYITTDNCAVFMAGDITDVQRRAVDIMCESVHQGGKCGHLDRMEALETTPQKVLVPGGQSQSSIRIGCRAFTRQHPDFRGLNYVTTVLGGYFGARLSMKVREELGLTYNIYSSLDTQVYGGDMTISTEVSQRNTVQALDAIYQEMELLQNEQISAEEITLVNNYMMGNYLNLFDGPFNSIRAIKSLALTEIPLDKLDDLIEASVSFDAQQVQAYAQKYLNRQDFWEVIVGKLH